MEEEEEVVFEDSLVHRQLKKSGFSEVETIITGKTYNSKSGESDEKPLSPKRIRDDYNILEEILTIKSTNLLFEDDLNHIDDVLENTELNKNEQLKYVFMGSACAGVLAIGLWLYFIIGYYAMFLISIYYTYRASDYLWKKHRRLKMLRTLVNALKCNFSLLNRVLKFIQENESIVRSRLSLKESEVALRKLTKLKDDVIQHQRRANEIIANFTRFLLNELPLLEYVDEIDNYICKSIEPMHESENASQLYNMYLLLQSQFLTRLTFSIVPSLLLNPDKSHLIVYKTMYKISIHLQELHTSLDKKFKCILYNGIYIDQSRSARPLARPKPDMNTSVQTLVRNVHDLSNSLQYSLIKARELETSLETDPEVNTGKELEEIQNELTICQSHISDLLILQNQSRSMLTNQNINHKNCEKGECEFATITELGYPDLDPKVDDDLFEAVIHDSSDIQEVILYDDEEIIDPLARKKRKLMLNELKNKLKDKADEWSQRESAIRARKGLPIYDELPLVKDDSTDSESEKPKKKSYREKYGDSSSDEEFDRKPNIEFQQALLQLQKNFVPQTEYFICDTTEDD